MRYQVREEEECRAGHRRTAQAIGGDRECGPGGSACGACGGRWLRSPSGGKRRVLRGELMGSLPRHTSSFPSAWTQRLLSAYSHLMWSGTQAIREVSRSPAAVSALLRLLSLHFTPPNIKLPSL